MQNGSLRQFISSFKWDPVPQFILLEIVTVLTFYKAFSAPYVGWDDPVMITGNPLLRLPFTEAIGAFFTNFYHGDYLPVTMLSYWLEISAIGFNPSVSHVINLGLHLISGWALYQLLQFTRIRDWGKLFICSVFLLHPLQVESVMWLSERKGLLSSALLLFALLSSLRVQQNRGFKKIFYLLTYYFLFLASLLSKATGVFVPLLLLGVEAGENFLIKKAPAKNRSPLFLKHAIPLLFSLIIIVVRVQAYSADVSNLGTFSINPTRLMYLPVSILSMIGFYLGAFFYPLGLSIVYPPFQLNEILMLRVLGVIVVAFLLFKLWKLTKNPELICLVLFFFTLLLPVLQIVPRVNFVNDRYMYLPLIGLAGVLVFGLEEISKLFKKEVILGRLFLVAVGCLLAALSARRSAVWSDDFSLWQSTAQAAPWSGLASNNFAMALEKKGDLAAAVREYERATEVGHSDGNDYLAYNNLGTVYSKYPEFLNRARAIDSFKKGLSVVQRPEESYYLRFNLAGNYYAMGEKAQALEILTLLEQDVIQSATDKKYLEILGYTQNLIKLIKGVSR